MSKVRTAGLTICCAAWLAGPATAQENWGEETLPPLRGNPPFTPTDIPQQLGGTEFIRAECEPFRSNVDFVCTSAPGDQNTVFVPIRLFARASTVEALAANVDDRFTTLTDLQETDRTMLRQGVAAAVAMGDASFPSAPGRTSYDFNLATFKGEEAVGGSIKHRLNSAQPMAISFGFSSAGQGNQAVRVGLSGEF